ncbi:hypothetical protein ABK040_012575 [Willaertia magna]
MMPVSRGVMQDCIKRLVVVYEQTSGEKFNKEEDEVQGLSQFDAQKYIIAKKIMATREKIKQRDTTKGGVNVRARLSNDVKKMIKAIKTDDFAKLTQYHTKTMKKKLFKKVDPTLIAAQESDIQLIRKHIAELEALSLRRYERKNNKNGIQDATTSSLLEGAEDDNNEKGNKNNDAGQMIVLEQDLPDDATKSKLQTIDISGALAKINDIQSQIDQGLDVFSKKLDDIHQMAKDIGSELDEQNMLLDEMDKKVNTHLESLKNLNMKVENALDKVGGSNKLMCIIFILIVITICLGALLIFLVSYFQ